MIIVTGGAGFLGSAAIWKLNEAGYEDILVVDNLSTSEKWRNLVNRRFQDYIHKDAFIRKIREGEFHSKVQAVIHMGACSSTTERDADYLFENNTRYSIDLCRFCLDHGIRFVNASSAATYGDGTLGFEDGIVGLDCLKPLNMYGYSKHLFDLHARRKGWFEGIVSLKFFNVFGPNEYHKGDMMSVVCKAHAQIRETGKVKLFKSHMEGYENGGQMRDFVYVKDCADVMAWLVGHPEVNGVFNVGSGKARSFKDLAGAVFAAMGRTVHIDYVDMPEAIRGNYQYFTEAPMGRLKEAGYDREFSPLEVAVKDYVTGYLDREDRHL